jgi:hypothetical protein
VQVVTLLGTKDKAQRHMLQAAMVLLCGAGASNFHIMEQTAMFLYYHLK